MIWYSSESSPQLLLVVHSPNVVILWNAQTGTKIWRVTYEHERQRETETFSQIVQDPFNHQRAICTFRFCGECELKEGFSVLGQSSLTFIEDFSPTNAPSGQSRRFYISNTNSNSASKASVPTAGYKRSMSTTSNSSTSSQLTTRLKAIMEGAEQAK